MYLNRPSQSFWWVQIPQGPPFFQRKGHRGGREALKPCGAIPIWWHEMARVRLNILCLVGAVIGVIAVFSTWITARFLFWSREMNLIDVYNQVGSSSHYYLPAVLLLIGAVVVFITPVGGILQVIGVPIFLSVFATNSDGKLPSGVGPYLALVGAVIVLASLVYPVGLGYRQKPVGVIGRFITISPASRLPQPSSQGIAESPPSAP